MKNLKEFLNESILDKDLVNDDKIETEAEIKEWLSEHGLRYSNITDISLNKGKVDITGNVGINDSNIPFKIGTVNGNFTIDVLGGEGSSKLNNFPEKITGKCTIRIKGLKNLKGFANEIDGDCSITALDLDSLSGLDNCIIGGELNILDADNLKDLKGISKYIKGGISILRAASLTNVNDIPKKINYSLHISDCPKLTNIPNINIVNDGNKSAIFNISSCKSLTSIGDVIVNGKQTLSIFIEKCPKLDSIGTLPTECDDLVLSNIGIKTFKGLPEKVKRTAKLSCKNVTKVAGLPKEIGNNLNIKGCTGLSDVEKNKITKISTYKKIMM